MLVDNNNGNYIKDKNPYLKFKDSVNNDILKLYFQFNHLKNVYRQGWLKHILGLESENKVESVADHSWSVTMLAMSVIEKYKLDLDLSKCMKLALVHELGEIYAGDLMPNEKTVEEKHLLEENAVDKLLSEINFDNDFKELWLEYENVASPEADFIKQIDKLECMLQAVCYGLSASDVYGDERIKMPCLREVLEDAKKINKKI